MVLNQFFQKFLPAVEAELQNAINGSDGPGLSGLRYMLAYALGWEGPGASRETQGKRIRPMLVLLVNTAAGGNWEAALPAAAAVELIHNFSLIHDDIEDQSTHRRGRPTIWSQWSIAQATNTGDAMFAIAHIELLRLVEFLPYPTVVRATDLLDRTCLHLTQGQYLDLAYERLSHITVEDYWPMIEGKTSALLAASCELGAMAASVSAEICQAYQQFGYALGLAFQAMDDYLGIWGDAELTGKSNQSDLTTGKKTLPVLYGLSQRGAFYQRWLLGSITAAESASIASLLAEEGAKEYTQLQVDQFTRRAISALETAQPQGDAASALVELAHQLLHRKS